MAKLKERNKEIERLVNAEISRRGLSGKLEVEPIDNTFTRRPRFFIGKSDGIPRFKILMWSVNKLDDESLEREVKRRVSEAQQHFGL